MNNNALKPHFEGLSAVEVGGVWLGVFACGEVRLVCDCAGERVVFVLQCLLLLCSVIPCC